MAVIECRTQAALDKALAAVKPGDIIACVGKDEFVVSGSATVEAWDSATVRASGSATVEAWGSATVWASGSATVRAWDSATVRAWDSATVEAWGSATVRASDSATVEAWDSATVEAWDSATVEASGSATVEAWDSATVRASGSATVRAWGSATVDSWGSATVEAWDSATVRASESATVRASKYVAVTVDRRRPYCEPTITGGVLIEIQPPKTARDWCEIYGVPIGDDGLVTLFKGVGDDFGTDFSRKAGIFYIPGTSPSAPDWDGLKRECGGGLHFSPHPWMAHEFSPEAKRYVACPVRLDEIVVHPDAQYPAKVKAPRVAGPIWECTADGEPVTVGAVAWHLVPPPRWDDGSRLP